MDNIRQADAAGKPIRLMIVEDNAIVREGLRSAVTHDSIQIVGEGRSPDAAIAQIVELTPDVVLLGAPLAAANGFSVLKAIRSAAPGAAVVVISIYDDPGCLLEAIAHGVTCYLAANISQQDVLTAVEAAARGRSVVDRAALVRAIAALSPRKEHATPANPAVSLTPREREALSLAAQGLNNREIAQQLSVSEGTVKAHLTSVFAKIQVSSRVRAVMWAVEHGMTASRPADDTVSRGRADEAP
ncbi:MAG TPA: response regulator transcription factor [Anaerolineae bacterium]|nr:response regulator transcription factor [Anaerolineae bacterium]HOQ99827.1 response regulator transcription factor [Anaerolineae bacterium]